jgi:hypothetical protein
MSDRYLYVDRSAMKAVPELDVPDRDLAHDLAQRPTAYIDPKASGLEPATGQSKPVEYNIKPLKMHFGEFLRHHATAADSTDWMKQFKHLLPGVVSDASLLMIGDEPVATFRHDAQLSKSRLEKEQPHIIVRYTKMKWVEVFDKEAFQKEEPALYEAYRGRSFRLVRKGSAAGLILPS